MNAVSIPGSEELEVLSPSCIEIVQVNHMCKARYRVFNGNVMGFMKNSSNMACYACFQFRLNPYASFINTIVQKFPLPEVTDIEASRKR
ncbi:hypothetical protein AVEN_179476-1 [Araneus ventricosus]|uniref:Uncharacterized protein n=1 Tax=Araneus ventricosus TaxID=182803 RepID=A0A4Y2BH07_ARAVE|nr:hypothetical protein AVEN_179476-1 [Araneus ventricosus]